MLDLDAYDYRIDPGRLDYDFESTGPNGTIKKIAQFTMLPGGIYNFGFGDLDEETGEIIDTARSRNGDAEKVLATIAHIIYEFAKAHPDHGIFVKGSTDSRTRLYQINLAKFWGDIESVVLVWGYRNDSWEVFDTDKNHEAFLCKLR